MRRLYIRSNGLPIGVYLRSSAAIFLCLLFAAPAAAQVSNLDKTTLIDALAEEGMSDLLLHLIEVEPPDDPVVEAQIEIAQYKLRYADPDRTRAEQLQAFDHALDRLRKLIADLPDHPQRPIWQTDLAEMLLTEYLGVIHRNAAEFYEFGVPSEEQAQAYERATVEALEAATSAYLRFFQLQTLLPRRPNHIDKRVNTGLWTRMIEDYYHKRTPFYLAQASHLVSLLPDDHPYFHRPNDAIPDKRPGAADEKQRLAMQTRQLLEPFADDTSDQAGVRMAALTLIGRSLLSQDRPDAAADRFETVISAGADGLPDFIARMGMAKVAQLKGRYPTAMDRLTALQDHPLAKDALLYRLLVADAKHRVLLAQAQQAPADQRRAAIAISYDPYLMLLDDPALGAQAAALKNFIYQRWAESIPADQDPAALPPMVRLAVGEIERVRGQNLAVEAEQTGDADTRQEAVAHLERSIRFNQTLTTDAVSEAVRAQAMFNLGMARYLTHPQDLGNILGAASTFVELADTMPDQPQAERAIAYAVSLLRALHRLDPRPAGVEQAYRRAADVLFEKFPTSQAADNERLYYGYYVLAAAGDDKAAVRMLSRVPPSHPDYLAAQREALFALEHAMDRAQGDERAALRAAVRQRAEDVRRIVSGDDSDAARKALAAVRLALAGAAANEGNTDEAIKHLTGFEDDFADQPQLVQIALERRITALARAGRMDPLQATAKRMMRDFPDSAAAVIDQVLTQIDHQLERLGARAGAAVGNIRKQEIRDQASQLATTALTLSQLLVDWARERGYGPKEMLAFELVHAKSLRLVGRERQAADITARLLAAFPDDAQVISSHAESLFELGDKQSLYAAAKLYDKLITGLPAPYPDAWWNAWMRRLQINDRLGEGTADIPLRVRQLKLTDPTLGGPRFRETLEALAQKHQ